MSSNYPPTDWNDAYMGAGASGAPSGATTTGQSSGSSSNDASGGSGIDWGAILNGIAHVGSAVANRPKDPKFHQMPLTPEQQAILNRFMGYLDHPSDMMTGLRGYAAGQLSQPNPAPNFGNSMAVKDAWNDVPSRPFQAPGAGAGPDWHAILGEWNKPGGPPRPGAANPNSVFGQGNGGGPFSGAGHPVHNRVAPIDGEDPFTHANDGFSGTGPRNGFGGYDDGMQPGSMGNPLGLPNDASNTAGMQFQQFPDRPPSKPGETTVNGHGDVFRAILGPNGILHWVGVAAGAFGGAAGAVAQAGANGIVNAVNRPKKP